MNWHKLITGIFVALFVGVAAWAGVFFLQLHRDLSGVRAQEAANQRRLAELREKLATQEKYLDDLRHDPALVERVIRKKLGYVRAEEFVFRFEETKSP
ncbi:MAG TPA: septum formation initiator family protein [Candidatus Didemnitutus sp.]|nr:septum formation initiator family protein [Candidatus Didemnitutus sp.]